MSQGVVGVWNWVGLGERGQADAGWSEYCVIHQSWSEKAEGQIPP